MTLVSTPRIGGLLGGSKLAQLAAKRKQKQEAAAASAETSQKPDTDKAIALLDRLSVKSAAAPSSSSGNDAASKPASRYTRKRSPSPKPTIEPEPEQEALPEPAKPLVEFPNLRATPSMFASTLCVVNESARARADSDVSERVAIPYPPTAPTTDDPFNGPSPDDIVLHAQKRGAGHR